MSKASSDDFTPEQAKILSNIADELKLSKDDVQLFENTLKEIKKNSERGAQLPSDTVKGMDKLSIDIAKKLGLPISMAKSIKEDLSKMDWLSMKKNIKSANDAVIEKTASIFHRLAKRFPVNQSILENLGSYSQGYVRTSRHPCTVVLPPAYNVSPLIRFSRWCALGTGVLWGFVRYYQICEKHADVRDYEHESEQKHELHHQKLRARAALGDVMEIAEHLNIPPDEAALILGSNIRKRGSGV